MRAFQVGALALGLAGTAQASRVWLRADLPGVEVYSDASQRNVAAFAMQYAAFRQAFDELVAPPGRRSPPATIMLFRNARTLQGYATDMPQEQRETLVNLESTFDGHPVSALALDGDRDEALFTVFESDATWMLQGLGYFLPLSVRQGTGEFFATFELSGDTCILGDTDRRFDNPLNEHGLMPWDHFFSINSSSPEYGLTSHTSNGLYQAQCWLLMHTVLAGTDAADARARFQRLCGLLEQSPSELDAFAAFFHTGRHSLNNGVYSVSSARTLRLPFDRPALERQLRVGPAPEADVRAQLFDLLITHDKLAAEVQLDGARALAPHSAAVNVALAHQALMDGDKSAAAQFYRNAIAAGTRDGAAYYYSASERLDDALGAGALTVGAGGEAAVTAVQELRRCLALLPGYGRAYAELGRAYLAAPKVTRAAIADLTPALADPALKPLMHFYIGLLYRRVGDRVSARQAFTALADNPQAADPLRQAARQQLAALASRPKPAAAPAPAPAADDDTSSAPDAAGDTDAAAAPALALRDITMRVASQDWNNYRSYLSNLVQKVQEHFQVPDAAKSAAFSGQISIRFTLGSDGSIADMRPPEFPEGTPAALVDACRQAVQSAAPFDAWGDDMTDELGHEQHVSALFDF